MHVHGNPMAAGVHSAAGAEKAAAAQRATETRKKLMKNASEIEGAAAFGELLMVGRWPEESSGRRHEQPQPGSSSQTEGDQEEQSAKPVSFWA